MYFLAAKMIEKMSVNNRGKLNITSSNILVCLICGQTKQI